MSSHRSRLKSRPRSMWVGSLPAHGSHSRYSHEMGPPRFSRFATVKCESTGIPRPHQRFDHNSCDPGTRGFLFQHVITAHLLIAAKLPSWTILCDTSGNVASTYGWRLNPGSLPVVQAKPREVTSTRHEGPSPIVICRTRYVTCHSTGAHDNDRSSQLDGLEGD